MIQLEGYDTWKLRQPDIEQELGQAGDCWSCGAAIPDEQGTDRACGECGEDLKMGPEVDELGPEDYSDESPPGWLP